MDKHTKTDPPFGDTPPCPMCPIGARNLSACAHNIEVRLPGGMAEGCGWGDRWYSLRCAVEEMEPKAGQFCPEIQALVTASRALLTALDTKAPWDDAIAAFRAALEPVRALVDAHFADERHSHGVLR